MSSENNLAKSLISIMKLQLEETGRPKIPGGHISTNRYGGVAKKGQNISK